jgi:hypothetical protein
LNAVARTVESCHNRGLNLQSLGDFPRHQEFKAGGLTIWAGDWLNISLCKHRLMFLADRFRDIC